MCVCERERERERKSMCRCVRERERERESMCVCVRERERASDLCTEVTLIHSGFRSFLVRFGSEKKKSEKKELKIDKNMYFYINAS